MRFKTFIGVLAGGFIGWFLDRSWSGSPEVFQGLAANDVVVLGVGIALMAFGSRIHPIMSLIGVGMLVFEIIETFATLVMGETVTWWSWK